MDRRFIFLIAGVILLAVAILALKKCNQEKILKPVITISKSEIREGDSIAYRDETKGANRWIWDFGDGETSTDQSGSHRYAAAGSYHILVKVSGHFRGILVDSSFTILVNSIVDTVKTNVNLDVAGPTSVMLGDKATFTCNTPGVVRYQWKSDELGGHIFDTTAKATYTFNTPGKTSITLLATMRDNSKGVKSFDVEVKNKKPAAAAGGAAPSPAVMEAAILKVLQKIADPAYTGDMPPEYDAMVKKYFCGSQQTPVIINAGKKKDIDSYCTWLLINKGTKVTGVKAMLNSDGCIAMLNVNQN